jgi:small-conductance mechanosensitive channel
METIAGWYEAVVEFGRGLEFGNPLMGLAAAVVVSVLGFVLYRLVSTLTRRASERIKAWEGSRIKPLQVQEQEILSADEIAGLMTTLVAIVRWILLAAIVVTSVGLVLGFFSWTQDFALRALDLSMATLLGAGRSVVGYVPSLMLVVVIVGAAWYLVRLARLIFNGIETERIRIRGFYPEWAMPTFNIVRILIFVFAMVMAFPYLPGAGSPAFRGVSIFIGVLLSLGSTSAVANVVAGIVITYMRAFKIGDRVTIDQTEGIVVERSMFVTRLRTRRNVEIAVPNSKVLANPIVNYSALARSKYVLITTKVGIGYDVDRRQVHELLLAAAGDTEAVADEPESFVQQCELGDYAVVYELNVPINRPHKMAAITSELNGHVLDRFHEAGVEIMSPAYTALRRGNKPAIPDGSSG